MPDVLLIADPGLVSASLATDSINAGRFDGDLPMVLPGMGAIMVRCERELLVARTERTLLAHGWCVYRQNV